MKPAQGGALDWCVIGGIGSLFCEGGDVGVLGETIPRLRILILLQIRRLSRR